MGVSGIENQIVAVEQDWDATRPRAGHHVGDPRVIAGATDHKCVRSVDETVVCIQIAMIKPRGRDA